MTKNPLWIAPEWDAPNSVVAGCTLRTGGVSKDSYSSLNLGGHVGDRPAAISENRRRFRRACKLPNDPLWLSQVHGTDVAVEPCLGAKADASFTRESGVVCAVLIADCLPVILACDDGEQVAVAHAGWRGLAAGVLEATVAVFDTLPSRLHAWLGPAISQSAFEVGEEVRQVYLQHSSEAARHFRENYRGRWQADLYGLARQRLECCGVRQISGGQHCTYDEVNRFFSYRRDGQCGRMAAFVYRQL